MTLKKHWLIYLITSLVAGGIIAVSCRKNNITKTETEEFETNKTSLPVNQNKYWEPIIFETINKKLDKINLSSLKNKVLGDRDKEIRLWIGFGESASSDIKGLILENTDGKWRGFYLPQDAQGKMAIQSKEPRSGWDALWKNLNADNFLTMPDITESKNNLFPDATEIVVEIKDAKNYRN